MQIDTDKIMEGRCNGEIVWICHYNRPDMQKKALRNVPPTKVIVRSNDELPPNKRVYYSASHFSPLNKKGGPLAKVISPVDNTGYRSRCCNKLYVFDNEEECIGMWNTQLNHYCLELDLLIRNAAEHWETEKAILINDIK